MTQLGPFRDAMARQMLIGQPFDEAWSVALSALDGDPEGDDWRTALEATRDAWMAAYADAPARRSERALAVLGTDPDRDVQVGVIDDWSACEQGKGREGLGARAPLLLP